MRRGDGEKRDAIGVVPRDAVAMVLASWRCEDDAWGRQFDLSEGKLLGSRLAVTEHFEVLAWLMRDS